MVGKLISTVSVQIPTYFISIITSGWVFLTDSISIFGLEHFYLFPHTIYLCFPVYRLLNIFFCASAVLEYKEPAGLLSSIALAAVDCFCADI